MLYKNTAGQTWRVFAFNRTTNAPATGIASTITANIALNRAAPAALIDLHPVEVEDGFYLFDLDVTETNGTIADLYPESSNGSVQVVAVPATQDLQDIPAESVAATDLETLMLSPKRTRTAEGTVEERTVDELIKADRYNNPAPDGAPWGIRVARMKPPSSCS